MWTVVKQFSKQPINRKLLHLNVKHFARVITGDRVTPIEDTLTGRFLLYLDNNKGPKNVSGIDKLGLIRSLKSQPADIKSFDASHVTSVLNSLNDRTYVQSKYEFNQLLHVIDEECCTRSNAFGIEDMFDLLDAFMNAIPQKITRTQYFHLALELLMTKTDQLSKDQLVHFIFYVGLMKKNAQAQSMIRKCMKRLDKDIINSLTQEDLCILCNASFKTSLKIKNIPLLERIKTYINDNLYLLNDAAVFVTLIKTLRHNRYQDDDILSSITCTIFFNRTLQYYSFGAICHILALYADYLYYDESILKAFTSKCLEQLLSCPFKFKRANIEEQPRTKDIKRFLWALSNLNFKLDKEDIEKVIIPEILVRADAGEFKNDPGSAVQMILYLWMMQYRAYDLIEMFLTREVATFLRVNQLPSQDSLNLLLTCIYYEEPKLYQNLNIRPENPPNYNQTKQLAKRPVLQTIIDSLSAISFKNDIDKFQVCCQVPYLNIIGVMGYQKKIYKTVNIEVLDGYTCLKNTENMPTGLMQLKLRILDSCDEALVVMEQPDVANYSDSELKQILEDEISLVC